jgi:carboxylesterase type B
MNKLFFILIFPILILAACSSGSRTAGKKIDINRIKVESGLLSGAVNSDGTVKIFMGIPFAAPPVGDLRWKAPQPPLKWEGIRKCVTPPPSAMQSKPAPLMMWSKEFQPAEELMKARGQWRIAIDSIVIPPPSASFTRGKQNDVPLISGWNADDGVSMATRQSVEAYIKEAEKRYGTYAEDYLKVFPATNDEEVLNCLKLTTVLSFGWQNYNWAKMQSLTGTCKAYLYFFTHVPPGEPNYGAFHSAEFGYALYTLKHWDRPFTQTDWDLADKMSSYWVNFAKTGNPNGDGLPEWPVFDSSSPQIIEFGDKVKAIPLPYKEQLEFFDKFNNR